MTKEVKAKSLALSKDTKTVVKNLTSLVEALALLTVSVYSGYEAYSHDFNTLGYKLLTVAAVLIGIRGSEQFLKHLANK